MTSQISHNALQLEKMKISIFQMPQAIEMQFSPPRREKFSAFFEVIDFCHWQIPLSLDYCLTLAVQSLLSTAR